MAVLLLGDPVASLLAAFAVFASGFLVRPLGGVIFGHYGDPRFYLIKESFLTGTWALLCFGSLLLPRPLMFYFARDFVSAGNPEAAARFDGLWQYPAFRYS